MLRAMNPLNASNRNPRSSRYHLKAMVRMLVGFSPWTLVLHGEGRNVSTSGLALFLPLSDQEKDLSTLLAIGDSCTLQIDDIANGDISPVQVPATLTRSTLTADGAELGFAFSPASDDIRALVSQLERMRSPWTQVSDSELSKSTHRGIDQWLDNVQDSSLTSASAMPYARSSFFDEHFLNSRL